MSRLCIELVNVGSRFEMICVGGCWDCAYWDDRKRYLNGLVEKGYACYWLIVMTAMTSNVSLGYFCDNTQI